MPTKRSTPVKKAAPKKKRADHNPIPAKRKPVQKTKPEVTAAPGFTPAFQEIKSAPVPGVPSPKERAEVLAAAEALVAERENIEVQDPMDPLGSPSPKNRRVCMRRTDARVADTDSVLFEGGELVMELDDLFASPKASNSAPIPPISKPSSILCVIIPLGTSATISTSPDGSVSISTSTGGVTVT